MTWVSSSMGPQLLRAWEGGGGRRYGGGTGGSEDTVPGAPKGVDGGGAAR
jgi:hypothetical protein